MTLFIIFCTGGIDFVGGYTYSQFVKHNLSQCDGSQIGGVSRKLGLLTLDGLTGEEIHAKLFEKKELKSPAYWKQIVSYY